MVEHGYAYSPLNVLFTKYAYASIPAVFILLLTGIILSLNSYIAAKKTGVGIFYFLTAAISVSLFVYVKIL